jgi:nucleoside-diphosphate-sugar epimerase
MSWNDLRVGERIGGRALVTGATGFVGRPLAKALQQRGAFVRGVARRSAPGPWDDFSEIDVRDDLPASTFEGVDTVFHLAALAHISDLDDDPDARSIGLLGTANVLRAAERAGVERFVFFSTVKAGDTPVSSAYAAAKLEAEKLVVDAAARRHTVVLRPSLVYGPNLKGNLARMLDAVGSGRFPPLPDVGNRRSLVHVDDVVEVAMLAAKSSTARGRVYVVTDGEDYSTRRIYDAMRAATGRPEPRWHVPVASLRLAAAAGELIKRAGIRRVPFDAGSLERLIGSAWYDGSLVREDLGWSPRHTLEESLRTIVDDQPIR